MSSDTKMDSVALGGFGDFELSHLVAKRPGDQAWLVLVSPAEALAGMVPLHLLIAMVIF